MVLDYSATAGIGYKVVASKKLINEYDKEDKVFSMYTHLNSLKQDESDLYGYTFGEIGSSYYTGRENNYYLFIKNPLDDIQKIHDKKENLEKLIRENGLEVVGEFDLHSGLLLGNLI